jgi:hypothetical protein
VEDNNEMDITDIDSEGVAWIHVAQDRIQWRALVNTAMNIWVSQKADNLLTS